jgi:hypothetical protein
MPVAGLLLPLSVLLPFLLCKVETEAGEREEEQMRMGKKVHFCG